MIKNLKPFAALCVAAGLAFGLAGCGDQIAAAMGAGVTEDGAMSLTLGTVGELVVGLAKPDFVKLEGLMIPSTANKRSTESRIVQRSTP